MTVSAAKPRTNLLMDGPNPRGSHPEPIMKTLCAPLPDLGCFGCCPPIRPAHYDPIDYVSSLRKEFAENRRRIATLPPGHQPIVGYHCWALGFLDSQGRRAGCLLHPCQNGGKDLRHLIDYGDKCRREQCFPARVFACLPAAGQDFWLPLVRGLNTFLYSSRRANPLFHLLLWGVDVLESLRSQAQANHWSATELLHQHSFLLDRAGHPKAHRYLLRLILEADESPESSGYDREEALRKIQGRTLNLPAIAEARTVSQPQSYAHQLELEADFLDYCRLGLGLYKLANSQALQIREEIRRLVESLAKNGSE